MRKMSLAVRVYQLADQYNIENTKVHTIVSSYIEYCKSLVLSGYRVDIIGLASVIPDVEVSDYNFTLAYECRELSKTLGLPAHTVYVIIQEYINSLISDVLSGKPIEMRGLLCVAPLFNEEGVVVKARSSISSQLKKKLDDMNTSVTSMRVHTHKLLKYNIRMSGDADD